MGVKPDRIKHVPLAASGIPTPPSPKTAIQYPALDAIAFQTLHAETNATVSPLARAV
jgi:hypothetical protein